MNKLYLLITFVLLSTFISKYTLAQNETEPNNTPQAANVLVLNDSLTGEIFSAGDVDWFKVITNDDGRLDITVTNLNKSTDIQLQLFDGNAKSLLHDTLIKANTVVTMPTDGRGAGAYFIKVSGNNSATDAYKISDILINALEKNDPEPNNSQFNQNTTIHLNDTIAGHIGYSYKKKTDNDDWFVFTTTEDGYIHIAFTNESNTKYLGCFLKDSLTNYTGTYASPGNEAIFGYNGVKAGTYYVRVTTDLLPANTFGSYKFFVWLDTAKGLNDKEPNDLPSQALPLPVNSKAQGHIGYFHDHITDSADWYKIILPQDGMLKLNITRPDGYSSYFYLYDSNASKVINYGLFAFDSLNEDSYYFSDGLAAGTYYLKIQPYDTYFFGTYIVKDSLFNYSYVSDNFQENNDRPYLAKDIIPSQFYEGHVGFYNNLKRDTSDWWKLNYMDASGNLQFDFHLLPALIDTTIRGLQVQLFNDTLLPPFYTAILKDSLDTISLTRLKPGVYYIKINCGLDSNWCAYAFKANFNSVLATTFLSFTGSLQNNTALLQWSTANEINAKGFVVERSSDGRNFVSIGFVNAKTTASSNTYNFNDNNPFNNTTYYRLKEISKDGSFIYSPIISLNNHTKTQWYVSGNKDAKLILKLNEATKVSIAVVSMNGIVIKTMEKGVLQAGNYILPLNINSLASGIYSVKLLLNDKAEIRQFFKR